MITFLDRRDRIRRYHIARTVATRDSTREGREDVAMQAATSIPDIGCIVVAAHLQDVKTGHPADPVRLYLQRGRIARYQVLQMNVLEWRRRAAVTMVTTLNNTMHIRRHIAEQAFNDFVYCDPLAWLFEIAVR